MEYIVYFLVAIVAIFIVVKLLAWPLKILIRLLMNGVLGVILLFVVNSLSSYFNLGIGIGINAVTALVAGFFGVPGVIFLIIFKTMM
jgi:inhibitor of the pro-sigma K processing machinery